MVKNAQGSAIPWVSWDDEGASGLFGRIVPLLPKHFSRLLYANPVCLLTTSDPEGETQPNINIMTISWITPTTNVEGGLVMSMNATRYSASLLKKTKRFVLSIPVFGMEDLVKSIGKCSGSDFLARPQSNECDQVPHKKQKIHLIPSQHKFQALNIRICRPGWKNFSTRIEENQHFKEKEDDINKHKDTSLTQQGKQKFPLGYLPKKRQIDEVIKSSMDIIERSNTNNDIAVTDCVAHLICEVNSIIDPPLTFHDNPGTPLHLTVFSQIKAAFVREKYWSDGNFAPVDPTLPPYLTFFGGGTFGYSATRSQLKDSVIPLQLSETSELQSDAAEARDSSQLD